MPFNFITAFAGFVIMWIFLAIFSKGPKSKMEFLRGDYERKGVSTFWFFVWTLLAALIGGLLPAMLE